MFHAENRLGGKVETGGETCSVRGIRNGCCEKFLPQRHGSLRPQGCPGAGLGHGRRCLNQTRAILMIEMIASSVCRPIVVCRMILGGGGDEDFLHVSPAQSRLGLQHERHDPGSLRSGTGSAAETIGVSGIGVIKVGSSIIVASRSRTIRGRQSLIIVVVSSGGSDEICAWFCIIGRSAIIAHGGDGDGVNGIGKAIVIGIVPGIRSIASGE